MFEYIRQTRTTRIAVGTMMVMCSVLAACGDKASDTSAIKSDPALGRDLALAAADSAAKPKLQDVPDPTPPAPVPVPVATPSPAPAKAPVRKPTPRPAPKPQAPAPAPAPSAPATKPTPAPAATTSGVLAVGTSMSFASNQKLCSNTVHSGDKFTADLTQSVNASNSVTLPAGSTGTFEIVRARTAANSGDSTVLIVQLVSVQYAGRTYPIESTVQSAATNRVRSASTTTDAKKVAGGAIIGGILGQIIGKNTKGTVIGAAAGAAAGTAAAVSTADYDTCLNSGANVTVTLNAPTTIRAAAAP